MNLYTKQKETHRLREQIYDFRGDGWGEGIGSLGSTCRHFYIYSG